MPEAEAEAAPSNCLVRMNLRTPQCGTIGAQKEKLKLIQ